MEIVMPWIDHPARQGDNASIVDWLRYRIGMWMQERGAYMEHRALYPSDRICPECGAWHRPDFECDGIPF
jgi:hypothetical protein